MAEKLKFYSLSQKKSFTTSDYKTVNKSGKTFAVATHAGKECWRIIGKKK